MNRYIKSGFAVSTLALSAVLAGCSSGPSEGKVVGYNSEEHGEMTAYMLDMDAYQEFEKELKVEVNEKLSKVKEYISEGEFGPIEIFEDSFSSDEIEALRSKFNDIESKWQANQAKEIAGIQKRIDIEKPRLDRLEKELQEYQQKLSMAKGYDIRKYKRNIETVKHRMDRSQSYIGDNENRIEELRTAPIGEYFARGHKREVGASISLKLAAKLMYEAFEVLESDIDVERVDQNGEFEITNNDILLLVSNKAMDENIKFWKKSFDLRPERAKDSERFDIRVSNLRTDKMSKSQANELKGFAKSNSDYLNIPALFQVLSDARYRIDSEA